MRGLPLASVPLPKCREAQICGLWHGIAELPGGEEQGREMADPEPLGCGPELSSHPPKSHSQPRPSAPLRPPQVTGVQGWGLLSRAAVTATRQSVPKLNSAQLMRNNCVSKGLQPQKILATFSAWPCNPNPRATLASLLNPPQASGSCPQKPDLSTRLMGKVALETTAACALAGTRLLPEGFCGIQALVSSQTLSGFKPSWTQT